MQCAAGMQVFVDYRSPRVGAFDEVRHVGERQNHAAIRLLHLGREANVQVQRFMV